MKPRGEEAKKLVTSGKALALILISVIFLTSGSIAKAYPKTYPQPRQSALNSYAPSIPPSILLQPRLRTCAISTGHGLLQDLDCDKVPDIYDNCPNYNPDQADQDRDGLGDACDPSNNAESRTSQLKERAKQREESFLEVKVISAQDTNVEGPGAVYPVKVKNAGRRTVKVVVEALGVDFGTYRVDPEAKELKPGEEATFYLHVLPYEDAEPGVERFTLLVKAGSSEEEATLTLNLYSTKQWWESLKGVEWGVLAAALITLALVLAARKRPKRKRKEREELYSYY